MFQKRSPFDVLADPAVRLGVGIAGLLVTAVAARGNRVGPAEAKIFRAVNGLPDSLYLPAWAVMQLGTIGAAPAAAGTAWLAGDGELAGRLLAGGTGTWALSKLVKRMVRRSRPATLLPGTHRRGRDAAGLGYLSGHAGVAVALGAVALPRLGPAGRALTLSAVPAVGLTRVYVGAHLPLDIAGGAALGLAVGAAVDLAKPGAERVFRNRAKKQILQLTIHWGERDRDARSPFPGPRRLSCAGGCVCLLQRSQRQGAAGHGWRGGRWPLCDHRWVIQFS